MHIENRLQALRNSQRLSAAKLATLAGTTRQTIHAMEAGNFVPNTALALQLARALDVAVEQIFSIPPEPSARSVRAELLENVTTGQPVRLCRVDRRLLAIPASPVPAYLPCVDGVVERCRNRFARVTVPAIRGDANRLVLAGCDPALSLLNDLLERSGIEIVTVPSSSRQALAWLKQGRVHAAGSHLLDRATGEYNLPFIRRAFRVPAVKVVTFASWEQGFVVRAGNPKNIRSFADLARLKVTLINRAKGAGSRDLLDHGLRDAGISSLRVNGYDSVARGHLAAAYAVAAGTADCCIASRSAARSFGLDFIPLANERFDLAFTRDSLESAWGKTLLDLLNRSQLRKKLELIAGYDTSQTGRVLL